MGQECKVLWIEKDLLHTPTSKVIGNPSAERQTEPSLKDKLNLSVKIEFIELKM